MIWEAFAPKRDTNRKKRKKKTCSSSKGANQMDGDQRTRSRNVKSTEGPHLEVFDRRAEGRSGGREKRSSDFPTWEFEREVGWSSGQLFKGGEPGGATTTRRLTLTVSSIRDGKEWKGRWMFSVRWVVRWQQKQTEVDWIEKGTAVSFHLTATR